LRRIAPGGPKKKPLFLTKQRLFVWWLGRNRTIDTRIFNAVLETKDILSSKFNSGQAKVVCVFCAIADAGTK
jgi:hypothetical protein